MKLGRKYKLYLNSSRSQETIVIEPPFTIQFNCTRNTLASTNTTEITIYNLGINTRAKLYHDKYDFLNYWTVVLDAGYGQLFNIFTGNVYEMYSVKQGTDWLTKLECKDGIYAVRNGFCAQGLVAGTTAEESIKKIIDSTPQIDLGVLGNTILGIPPTYRGKVLFGSSRDLLLQETQNNFYIDNGKVYSLDDSEIIDSTVILLDNNQLLATPRRREAMLEVEILFLPQARLRILAEIDDPSYPIYNGQYQIYGFSHNVLISESMPGEARTTLQLNRGVGAFKPLL